MFEEPVELSLSGEPAREKDDGKINKKIKRLTKKRAPTQRSKSKNFTIKIKGEKK